MKAIQSTVSVVLGEQFSRLSEAQRHKALEAKRLFSEAFNTQEFCDWMCGFSHKAAHTTGRWPFRKTTYEQVQRFHMNELNGVAYSNEQVYAQLKSGKEILSQDGADGEADIFLDVNLSHTWGVVGYTYPKTNWQWIYSKFFNQYKPWDIAGNISHEWCHKMGWKHEFDRTTLREFSVPYAVGYKIAEISKVIY